MQSRILNMKYIPVLCLIFICTASGTNTELPDFLKQCDRNDHDFDTCLDSDLNGIWSQTKAGNKEFGIQQYNPAILLDTLTFNYGPFTLSLINPAFYYVDYLSIVNPSINWENHTLSFTLANDLIIWKAQYKATLNDDNNSESNEVDGNEGTINWVNGSYPVTLNFDLVDKNGQQYINLTGASMQLNAQKNFDFSDLDNAKNPAMKSAWNNAKNNFVTPAVIAPCAAIVMSVLNSVFNKIPVNELFPNN